MPVVDKTDKIAPRSALRYRPIAEETGTIGRRTFVASGQGPRVTRASRPQPRQTDMNIEIKEWLRVDRDGQKNIHTSTNTRRTSGFTKTLPKNRPMTATRPMIDLKHLTPQQRKTYQKSPVLYVGLGMLGAIILWSIIINVANWISIVHDDLQYGRPRTYQTDQVVGHNDSASNPSHFLVINLNRHIEIFEIQGGDPAHSKVYNGPQLLGQSDDLTPATLSFADVNGDHKPDMILHIQGTEIVYINDQGGFRPLKASEHDEVERFLHDHPQAP